MRGLLGAALFVWLVACGGSSANRRCRDSSQVPCLTDLECSHDEARDCDVCRCASPGDVPIERTDPLPPASPE